MLVRLGRVTVPVGLVLDTCWDRYQPPVANFTSSDYVLGESPDLSRISLEHRDFHATAMMKMNVQGEQRQVMMIMKAGVSGAWKVPATHDREHRRERQRTHRRA
jgi:hypothetical protein